MNTINTNFSAQGENSMVELIRNGAFLVDVRSAEEFSQGSAPGAVNIPLDEIPYSTEKFQGKGPIIVFCRSGNRSGQAKFFLERAGIQNVTNGGTWMDVAHLVAQAKA